MSVLLGIYLASIVLAIVTLILKFINNPFLFIVDREYYDTDTLKTYCKLYGLLFFCVFCPVVNTAVTLSEAYYYMQNR